MKKKLLSKINEHSKPDEVLPVKYIIKASIKSIENENILFISLFGLDKNKKRMDKANFKIFIKGRNYITQKLIDDGSYKWSNASMEYLTDYWYRTAPTTACNSNKDISSIENFLEVKCRDVGDPYKAILEFQKQIMQERLNAKHSKIKAKIDNVMNKVPPLPKSFSKWVYSGPFSHSRYIYYKRRGKEIECFCTECKKDFMLNETGTTKKNIKHNNAGKCPRCGKGITYKAKGKSTRVEDCAEFSIMQKFEDGFIVRYFFGKKFYGEDYKNPKLDYWEETREILTLEDGVLKSKKYHYGDFMQTNQTRWCEDDGRHTPKAYLYTRNLRKVLKNTKWQYSCLYEFAKTVNELHLRTFLEQYLKHPQIEYLIKFKLYNFVDEHLGAYYANWKDVNFRGRTIRDVLGIDKTIFLQTQRLNLDASGLGFIKKAAEILNKSNGITDYQVNWAISNVQTHQFNEMLHYSTPHKIIKYIERQANKKYEAKDVLSDWCDYIRQCKELKFDISNSFILYPKNLQERHDELTIMQKSEGLTKYDKKIKGAFEDLDKHYSYYDRKLIIRPAKCVNEIITEGHKLRHCVGNNHYVSGVAKGERAIMVIRKIDEPDTPFFTLELNLKTMYVSQCRGYKNCSMTDGIKRFIEKWEESKFPEKLKKAI